MEVIKRGGFSTSRGLLIIKLCTVSGAGKQSHNQSPEHLINICVESVKRILSQAQASSPEVIKLFPCSTQLSTKFILLINVKMLTIVGILIFISMINTTYERLKARCFFNCRYCSFYER